MGLKTKIVMAMATSAAGAAMVVGGSFALFSANASTNSDTFTAGTVKVTAPTDGWHKADSLAFSNMAPGDTVTESFQLQNTGSLAEWIALENTPNNVATGPANGAPGNPNGLFYAYTNSSVDSTSGTADNTAHGYGDQANAASGGTVYTTPGDFQADNHPAQYSYVVKNTDGTTLANSNPRSDNDWSDAYNHPFMVAPGQTVTVTYSVTLPLAAHNDYQNAAGNLSVEVDAVQVKNNWYDKGTGGSRQDGMPGAGVSIAWPFSWQPEQPGNN
jgi:spore coat-associated protein N